MTIAIELPDETVATLIAQAQGRPAVELAADVLTERFGRGAGDEFPLDEDTIESIRHGIADIEAGRVVSLEETRAHIEAALQSGGRSKL